MQGNILKRDKVISYWRFKTITKEQMFDKKKMW